MSFVAVDLGASGSRYTSDAGQISVAPNNMVILPDMSVSNIMTDATDVESCLEVQIERTTPSSVPANFPVNALVGIMAEKHRGANERPNMLMHKHGQRINYISAILACAMSKIKYGDLTDNLDLYIAVPPIEVEEARKVFANVLVGGYKVTLPKYMGGTEISFTIDGVKCYEEALMASTSFFFNMNGTPREQTKHFITGTILSLDIGASTTDLAIIKNGRYLDKSGQTFKTGGNEALDSLIDAVRSKYAIDLPIVDAEKAMVEGRLQMGNRYDDISDIVAQAKTELAKKLISNMPGYFKRNDIPIQTINAIMVSGGGSMQSQYVNDDGEIVKTSEPMSYYVTHEMTSWCPGVDVVEYGEDARFANIKGLFIRAKMDARRKAESQAASPIVNTQPAQAPVQQAVAPQPQPQPVVQTVAPQPQVVVQQAVAPQPQVQPVVQAVAPTVTPVETVAVAPEVVNN